MDVPSIARGGGRAWLLALAVTLTACATRPAPPVRPPDEGWTTTSPGGVIQVQVRVFDLGGMAGYPAGVRPYYRAFQGAGNNRVEVLSWSPLGITRLDQDFTGAWTFVDESSRPVDEAYTLPRGKRHQY